MAPSRFLNIQKPKQPSQTLQILLKRFRLLYRQLHKASQKILRGFLFSHDFVIIISPAQKNP